MARSKAKAGRKKIPRGNPRKNHHLVGARVLSRNVDSITYKHAQDGKMYEHAFRTGVTMLLLKDGRVELYRPDGRELWDDM